MKESATLQEEALRIASAAEEKELLLRLIGGVAIQLGCPSAEQVALRRSFGDIDFCVLSSDVPRLEALFVELGYEPWLPFNRLNMEFSQRFDEKGGALSIDVFVDQLRMCHVLDFRDRLALAPLSLPFADLLLSKTQIVELTEKDLQDMLALLSDHPIGGDETEAIEMARVVEVCRNDWGWYRTTIGSLERARQATGQLLDGDPMVLARINELIEAIEEAPKSRRWKLRARVGERKRWYEEPEVPERKA